MNWAAGINRKLHKNDVLHAMIEASAMDILIPSKLKR